LKEPKPHGVNRQEKDIPLLRQLADSLRYAGQGKTRHPKKIKKEEIIISTKKQNPPKGGFCLTEIIINAIFVLAYSL